MIESLELCLRGQAAGLEPLSKCKWKLRNFGNDKEVESE